MDATPAVRRRPLGFRCPMTRSIVSVVLIAGTYACARDDAPEADIEAEAPVPADTAPPPPPSTTPAAVEDTAGLTDAWTDPPIDGDGDGTGQAVLQDVRVAAHQRFDRIVFDFAAGPLPGYEIRFLDGPATQCGSGEPVDVGATHGLEIALRSVAAHTEAGEATVLPLRRRTDLPNLRSLRLICDYEGHVDWIGGLAARTGIRVATLREPTRLVVDVAHADTVQPERLP